MKHKPDLRKHKKAIAILILACLAALAVLVFVEGPEIITKEVKGLKLEQDGFDIKASWDSMDCRYYTVTVTCEGKKYTVPEVKKNHIRLKHVAFDKVYDVRVSAILNSGRESRPASADIKAQKLPNEITADIEQFDGFKDDSFRIEASGIGDIGFASDNDKVATVDSDGNVKLIKRGHATITVSALGDGSHMSATKDVTVRVFPEKLGKATELKAEYTSESTVLLSWKSVDFATEYRLMKKSLATGDFYTVRTVPGEETSLEMNRATGTYAIMPKAVIGEKTAEGEMSETVGVKGITDEMQSYSSWKNLRSLTRSNLVRFRTVRGDGNCTVPQSISITPDCYVISYVNGSGTSGKLCSYRKSDGECIDISPCEGMGYANGSTYDPFKDKFYVVKTHKGYRTASCSVYNGTSKDSEGTFDLPRVTSGIAYDMSNNKYYLSKGNEIYVCDSEFNVEKFIHKKIRYNHAQDIGAYNGIVFVCTWVSGNNSYIDMYRASDGAYLGGYDVSFGEIESCVVDDGYLVILMNNATGDGDCIYKTKERLPIH